jgi:hypothetical protein
LDVYPPVDKKRSKRQLSVLRNLYSGSGSADLETELSY